MATATPSSAQDGFSELERAGPWMLTEISVDIEKQVAQLVVKAVTSPLAPPAPEPRSTRSFRRRS